MLNFSEISQIQNKTFYWKRKFLTKILLYMKIILYIHTYFSQIFLINFFCSEFYAFSSDINHFHSHQFYRSLLNSSMNFSLVFLFFIFNFNFGNCRGNIYPHLAAFVIIWNALMNMLIIKQIFSRKRLYIPLLPGIFPNNTNVTQWRPKANLCSTFAYKRRWRRSAF